MTIEEYNSYREKIRSDVGKYIEREGLLNPDNPQEFYASKKHKYLPSEQEAGVAYDSVIPLYQLVNEIDNKIFSIHVLGSRLGMHDKKQQAKIKHLIDNEKEKLQVLLDQFEQLAFQHREGMPVQTLATRLIAHSLANDIVTQANGDNFPHHPDYTEKTTVKIYKIYEEYQRTYKAKGNPIRYYQYLKFMHKKEDGYSHRRTIRDFEDDYANDLILRNPNYDRRKYTKFDISRISALDTALKDIPYSREDLQQFADNLHQRQHRRRNSNRQPSNISLADLKRNLDLLNEHNNDDI